MAIKKSKRVEVISPKIKCFGEIVTFEQILSIICGKKFQNEFKDHEIKLISSDLPNCTVGIVMTGQNKDLPPKRNNQTGKFSQLNLDINKEKLSFGNIFLYDSRINVFFYELNVNGCYLNKLAEKIQEYWNSRYDDKIELSFISVSRKGEYQRLLRMRYYKEFYVELTNPTEILQDYKDTTSSLFSVAKSYISKGMKNNSDVFILKFATFGKKVNKLGLSYKAILELAKSFGCLLAGEQRKNVKRLQVKGYFTDPNEPQTLQPINLVSDIFNIHIKLTTQTLHSNLQEMERKEEIEKLYLKHLPELNYIFARDNESH